MESHWPKNILINNENTNLIGPWESSLVEIYAEVSIANEKIPGSGKIVSKQEMPLKSTIFFLHKQSFGKNISLRHNNIVRKMGNILSSALVYVSFQ